MHTNTYLEKRAIDGPPQVYFSGETQGFSSDLSVAVLMTGLLPRDWHRAQRRADPRNFPGAGGGNPLQYSCLEKSMDRGAWWAMVQSVTKSWILNTCGIH